MRILLINYEYPPLGGGAGNATKFILREFKKMDNIEIELVTSSINSFYVQDKKNTKIHFIDIGKRGNIHYQRNKDLLSFSWKSFWYIRKLLKTKPFDLVHAFFGIPSGFIARQFSLPYIVSLRGSDVPFYNQRFAKLDRLVFARLSKGIWSKAGSVIANSQGLKDLALKTSPNQKIDIIYNGVDTDFFCPPKKKETNTKFTIISTGRLNYLINALNGVANTKLILIGDGNQKESLQALAQSKNVNVEFLGKLEHKQIAKQLQQADLFALTSLNEGMSNAVLEAMASGLPILSTNVGGATELISDNGFLIEPANETAINEVITTYLRTPELLTTHGQQSRKKALEMKWSNVAKKYLTEYKKVISNNKKN